MKYLDTQNLFSRKQSRCEEFMKTFYNNTNCIKTKYKVVLDALSLQHGELYYK